MGHAYSEVGWARGRVFECGWTEWRETKQGFHVVYFLLSVGDPEGSDRYGGIFKRARHCEREAGGKFGRRAQIQVEEKERKGELVQVKV